MAVTIEDIRAERARRSQAVPGISLQDVRAERSRRNEASLSAREGRGDIASAELGASRTPGLVDYIPGAGILQDIPDIISDGFNSPKIKARRGRREQAAKTLVPYAASALGGAAGAGIKGLGLAGRAIGAGLGSGAGDVAGQAVTQGGEIDPAQALTATAAGVVGQPIGEALGAALPAVARKVFRGGEAGRQGVQAAIDDAAKFGQVPTAAQATGRTFLDGLEGILAKTPGSAGRLRKHVETTTQGVRAAIERRAAGIGGKSADAELAGQHIIKGVEDFSRSFQEKARPLYDKITAEVGGDTAVAATEVSGALTKITAGIKGAEKISERFSSPFIRGLTDDIAVDAGSNGTLPFEALQKFRSLVGEKLGQPGLTTDAPTAQLKTVYAALSRDIENAAEAAGPIAKQAFQRANRFYRAGSRRIEDTLGPLIKSGVPEKVFSSLTRGSKQGPTQIRQVYRSLSKDQQDVVTGAVIRNLGRATSGQQGAEGAEFSFNTFLTNWDRIDRSARDVIFKRGRNVAFGEDISALARYSERVKTSSRAFANPSGTSGATLGAATALTSGGSILAAPVLGGGLLTLPLILGGGSAVANLGSRLITSPRFVRWLAQSTKIKPNGIGAHVARLTALSKKEDPNVQDAISEYLGIVSQNLPQGQ